MNISTPIAISCPLCHSNDVEILDTLKSIDLVDLYQAKLALDISRYVTSDIRYLHCKRCDLGFFDPCPMGDAEFYETLQANPWYYMDEKPEYDLVQDFIINNVKGSVLEIGGGSGHFAKKIADHVTYTGLEFNQLAIQKARLNGITMIRQSIEEHSDVCVNEYDCVVSFQVLEHISCPSLFVASSIKALKKGGYLVIAVPNKDGVVGKMTNIPLDMPPHHATHWRRSTLSYFEKFDLDVVEIIAENVSLQHNLLAQKYLFLIKFFPFVFNNNRLINNSFLYSALNFTSSIAARIMPTRADVFNNLQGHTIIGIFKKR